MCAVFSRCRYQTPEPTERQETSKRQSETHDTRIVPLVPRRSRKGLRERQSHATRTHFYVACTPRGADHLYQLLYRLTIVGVRRQKQAVPTLRAFGMLGNA